MTGCVAVAHYQIERLIALGLPRERIRLISYGVPIDEFPERVKPQSSTCRYLAVGRLVAKKAPDKTIRAFARCIQCGTPAELRILGEGPMRADCEKLARKLDIADSVTFLGAQPIDIVKQELGDADVFVQHSVTSADGDMEGWPVAVAEAAASSLPIVATRHAGIVDQVVDGETGFLVDEGDWESMGDCMATLSKRPDLRVQLGAASRAHIAEFNFPRQIEKLESFLLDCNSPRVSDSGGNRTT